MKLSETNQFLKAQCVLGLIFLCLVNPSVSGNTNRLQPQGVQIAFVGFVGSMAKNDRERVETALLDAIAKDSRMVSIDQSIVRPALTGVGYTGSINLSNEEARKIGAAIGCDFFLLGKTEVITRSEHQSES